MSKLVDLLTYESAEWYTEEEVRHALTDGMEEITQIELIDCHGPKDGTIVLDKKTNVYNGFYSNFKIKAGDSIGSPIVEVAFLGTYFKKVETESFRTHVVMTNSENGDGVNVRIAELDGVSSIGCASISWLKIGSLGHSRIWSEAEIGDLEVYGSAVINSDHVKRIILHTGGKIKLSSTFKGKFECDPGRTPTKNQFGWICG